MNKLALNRLNLWQKLGAIVLAMFVPTVLVGFFYFTSMGDELTQTRSELQGVRFLQAIGAVESHLLTHGARAYVFASGDKTRHDAVAAMQRDVDAALNSLGDVSARS